MVALHLFRVLLWPVRKPFAVMRHKGAAARRGADRAAQLAGAPITGAVARANTPEDLPDVRHGVLFKIFTCPTSDEQAVGPNDVMVASKLASRARAFYKLRADLFPPDDIFYEEVEADLVDQVSRIDNDGCKDQFVSTLDRARRLSNDNTRKLLCEFMPWVLGVLLFGYAIALMVLPTLGVAPDFAGIASNEAWRVGGGALVLALAVAVIGFTYLFSYTHIQRANALSLNAFIATEFAHLNNTFLVSQREALQAETQLADTQKDEIKRLSSSWTLAYHWISVRQFFEEMFVRNTMFQIRRNTTLYGLLGVLICVGVFLGCALIVLVVLGLAASAPSAWLAVAHLALITVAFVVLTYGLIIRRPFSIVASSLMKDEWYRHDTLGVGDAIAEQVTRDKMQIVINRDRARAVGA